MEIKWGGNFFIHPAQLQSHSVWWQGGDRWKSSCTSDLSFPSHHDLAARFNCRNVTVQCYKPLASFCSKLGANQLLINCIWFWENSGIDHGFVSFLKPESVNIAWSYLLCYCLLCGWHCVCNLWFHIDLMARSHGKVQVFPYLPVLAVRNHLSPSCFPCCFSDHTNISLIFCKINSLKWRK